MALLGGVVFFLGPTLVLIALAWRTQRELTRKSSAALGVLAVFGTLAWLAYAATVAHVENGKTVFGAEPLLDENDALVWLPFVGMFLAAAVAGWHRLAASASIGTAVIVGPVALAWWTTPRGDNDGLWGLIFWFLPIIGGLAAFAARSSTLVQYRLHLVRSRRGERKPQ